MLDRRKLYAHYEKQLTLFSTSLVAEFIRSADAIGDAVSNEELEAWAEDGLELARQSWRSWEAAGEYFRVAPQMLPMLGWEGFRRWAKYGRDLAEMSSALAAAYFRASPATLPSITFVRLGDWVNLGRLLYKGTWRSASLAVQFFEGSPTFFSRMTLDEGRVLVRFVDALCDRSYDLASHCLSIAPHVLEPLGGEDGGDRAGAHSDRRDRALAQGGQQPSRAEHRGRRGLLSPGVEQGRGGARVALVPGRP